MILRVQYPNQKHDYLSSRMIDNFIAQKQIMMFYRPSQKRWIDIERDTIRRASNVFYIGPERRSVGLEGV